MNATDRSIAPSVLLLTAGVLVAYFASCEMGKPFFYSKIAPEKEEGKKK
jgi:hypothetical protein